MTGEKPQSIAGNDGEKIPQSIADNNGEKKEFSLEDVIKKIRKVMEICSREYHLKKNIENQQYQAWVRGGEGTRESNYYSNKLKKKFTVIEKIGEEELFFEIYFIDNYKPSCDWYSDCIIFKFYKNKKTIEKVDIKHNKLFKVESIDTSNIDPKEVMKFVLEFVNEMNKNLEEEITLELDTAKK